MNAHQRLYTMLPANNDLKTSLLPPKSSPDDTLPLALHTQSHKNGMGNSGKELTVETGRRWQTMFSADAPKSILIGAGIGSMILAAAVVLPPTAIFAGAFFGGAVGMTASAVTAHLNDQTKTVESISAPPPALVELPDNDNLEAQPHQEVADIFDNA